MVSRHHSSGFTPLILRGYGFRSVTPFVFAVRIRHARGLSESGPSVIAMSAIPIKRPTCTLCLRPQSTCISCPGWRCRACRHPGTGFARRTNQTSCPRWKRPVPRWRSCQGMPSRLPHCLLRLTGLSLCNGLIGLCPWRYAKAAWRATDTPRQTRPCCARQRLAVPLRVGGSSRSGTDARC